MGGQDRPHRRSGRSRSTGRGWCGGSTSTATTRPTGSRTAASTAPCSSTRSTPTATGSASSAATTSPTAQFGENFTVEGLADDEVCIGDRYRIGGALFEVTQPRVTCYRVGIRMDEPAMPSLLVAHHRPGFYLRVLEEGPVQAGDAIVKVADGPGAADGRARSTRCSTSPASRARCSSGRCACRRSARAGRGASASCSPRPSGGARRAPAWTGLPAAARRGGPPRERDHHLVPARARPTARSRPDARRRPVPHRARAAGRRRAAAGPQLLAVGPARRARLPDQRQARGRRPAATCTST